MAPDLIARLCVRHCAQMIAVARGPLALAEKWVGPLVDLFIRLLLFRVFFWAGTAKLGNWSGTLELFEYEYQIPFMPPVLSAYFGTAAELGCSCLLLVGLAARLAALPLMGITLTIQFVLGARNPAYDQWDHFFWLALLLTVAVRGPGFLSLDALLVKKCAFTDSKS